MTVGLIGLPEAFSPDKITGDVRQGDQIVYVTNDEIQAASWPAPVAARDYMMIDGRRWSVTNADPIYDGALCIGHDIYIRGGGS